MTLRSALASADSKAPYVRRLFHTIADRYDLITGLLSFGRDRRWKATLVALAGVQPGTRALDLAAGTGDIAYALAARESPPSTSPTGCCRSPRQNGPALSRSSPAT
jgi:ubiquinone/menaquinone biosynthesis C-methylase UbiE